jgi:hypothetical protein
VGDDRLLRVAREPGQEPAGHHDGRVLHPEPGGARVRGRGVYQQHAGRRHPGGDCHLLHQVREPLLGQIAGPRGPALHSAEHPADAGAPEREPHDGPEQHGDDDARDEEQTDQPVPRHVHVGPPDRGPHGGQQVERAVEPGGERRGHVHDQVGQPHRHGDDGDEQRRYEDGEGDAGNRERCDDQGGEDGAGAAVTPLLVEEVDPRGSGHSDPLR